MKIDFSTKEFFLSQSTGDDQTSWRASKSLHGLLNRGTAEDLTLNLLEHSTCHKEERLVCFSILKFTLRKSSFHINFFSFNTWGLKVLCCSKHCQNLFVLHVFAHSHVMSVYPKLMKGCSCAYVMETFVFWSIEHKRIFLVCLKTLMFTFIFVDYFHKVLLLWLRVSTLAYV